MTLQRKTLLIFGASFLCLLATLYLVASFILQSNIDETEHTNARHTLRAARGSLDQMIDQFSRRFTDWSAWDDAAEFVQNGNARFIESNLGNQSLQILHIDLIIFLNSNGKAVFATGFDPQKSQKTPVPAKIRDTLKDAALTTFQKPDGSHQGLLSLDNRLMMLTTHPIVTSELKGPVRGTLIVGRYLDNAEMRRLGEWSGVSLSIRSLSESALPQDFQTARAALSGLADLSEPFIKPLNKQQLGIYGTLQDIHGKPSLLLQAVAPRDAYAQGMANLRSLVFALCSAAFVFGAVTLFLMRSLVLTPLLSLSNQVRQIRHRSDLRVRIAASGGRELSGLAADINDLLGAVQESQEKLRESEERFRSATQSAALGVALVSPDGRWLQANRALCQMLGYTEEELLSGDFQSITHSDDLPADLESARQLLDGSLQTYQIEKRYRHKDGHWVPGLLNVSLVRTQNGEPVYFVAQIQDITRRKQTEAALKSAHAEVTARADELEQRNKEMNLVGEMGEMLQSCRNRDEAGAVIVQSLRRLFPDESGALCVMNSSQDRVEVGLTWGDNYAPHIDSEAFFTPDECWALRRGRAHVVTDVQKEVICPHVSPQMPAGYICLPLMAERQTLGVLHLCQNEAAPWLPTKIQLARTVAEQISLALFNLELQATLRAQSVRDPMTGLFNRRHMEESLVRELSRAQRRPHEVSLILFDVDHFKRFNDTFGHDAGDLVLKEVARVLQSKSRKMDIACRYGGEEFLLILPECPLEFAVKRAEELRQIVKDLALSHQNRNLGQVTLSLGVVCYPTHGSEGEELVRAADVLLYQAKQAGRDRVMAGKPDETATAADN